MSGSLRIHRGAAPPPGPHDHVDLQFGPRLLLRYTDPRRFGALLLADDGDRSHALLRALGPEPLEPAFDGDLLYRCSRDRRVTIKALIMDSRVVVGVGNIYANEALYRAGIRPQRRAGRLSRRACDDLAQAIKAVLAEAIEAGGTTLRDFVGGDGRPGYFRMALAVYGRGGQPCPGCGTPLRETRLNQRSTVYCPSCQR
jgi:formamidopyrimidine-DNA glycosylase